MKKTLILALFVVSAALAPCVRRAIELPYRVSDAASAFASPLFWHLCDELLAREVAQSGRTASGVGEALDWRPESGSDAVACLFFQILLRHAFDGSLSVAEKKDDAALSIPQYLVRHTVESGNLVSLIRMQ